MYKFEYTDKDGKCFNGVSNEVSMFNFFINLCEQPYYNGLKSLTVQEITIDEDNQE